MELLFNLIWAMVVIVLWGKWLHRQRDGSKAFLPPRTAIQIIAMAMLSAVLLPVISITDDLQAYHNPAEVQRTSDRNDRHAVLAKASHGLPVALALLAFCLRPMRLHTVAFLTANDPMPQSQIAFGRTLWSRPPPSA